MFGHLLNVFDVCEKEKAFPLLVVRNGSFLHGTANEKSDTDFKVVFLPSRESLLLGNPVHQFNRNTNNKTKNNSEDVDMSFVSLHKFLSGLEKGDLNSLELLFSFTNKEAVLHCNKRMNVMFENYEKFYNVNHGSFFGFVNSALKRLEKKTEFTRAEWKELSHCFRLLAEHRFLNVYERLSFPLENRNFLMKVKNGEYTFETLKPLLDEQLALSEELVRENEPNTDFNKEFVNKFLLSFYN